MIVEKFTPEAMISAPRRGPAIPNHDGTLALYTLSTHTIGGETLKEIRVMNIATGDSSQLFDDEKAQDAAWLGDGSNTVILLKKGGEGFTFLITIDADKSPSDPYIVGHIPVPVQNLKVKALKDGSVAFAVVGLAGADGQLFNPELNKPTHTGRIYDVYRAREWDTYRNLQKYSIFYSTLSKKEDGWKITGPLHNALAGTNLEAPINMYEPTDPRDNYDLSQGGITLAAEEPGIKDPLLVGISDIYYVRLSSFATASVHSPVKIGVQSEELDGYSSHPRFSPDGSLIAFLRGPRSAFEQTQIFIHQIGSPSAINVFEMVTGQKWPLTPSGFEFAPNGHVLYITADDTGRVGLYKVDLLPSAYPKTLLRNGAVMSYYPLGHDNNERLLVTSSTLVESSTYQIVDADADHEPIVVSSATKNGSKFGLSPKQVSEIYFEGGGDYCVHAWMVRPRNFDESKTYPLALLVHGGPMGAWNDGWGIRWNPALWAEQGYVVVTPNITGSTGYGIEFADAVRDSWGGRPYDDLVNCMEYLKQVPYIDTNNAIAAGGSYGGYMMNWIQGHPLGRRFKALVCHDGIFHVPSFMLQTDYLGDTRDFGGPPVLWQNVEGLERYNPARPDLLPNWKTPMLVIHSDKDYRCPITDGLAAFHTLQLLGTPSKFLTFLDEGHMVLKEENSLEWHRQVFAWINKYTGIAS
ncbi:prolyl oligopeptidase [Hypoxylon rubiginosum]|uniref:Prolyl oligopeptidase n=1 Tax=Hypoxylon rubiginosum TaxID=110542 RepID=A0ACB9Z4Z7_9PEZI|nr:prolyl oligopeptidase [Hypoxylon rubiginosum]